MATGRLNYAVIVMSLAQGIMANLRGSASNVNVTSNSTLLLEKAQTETITGHIYCDNYFEFYFNGELIEKDPLAFTPHNAVKVTFQYSGTGPKVYAILCQDFATPSGYEYTASRKPQLGDGALIAEFSDGTVTSSDWKSYVVTHGPTDASIAAGCDRRNLEACKIQTNAVPANWYSTSFDDSSWVAATQYSEDEAGWGKPPRYSNGRCGTVTNPYTKEKTGEKIATAAEECLRPKDVMCGGDEYCEGSEGRFIWGTDLERDSQMLFRYTI
eukprot:TRINITY_DN8553_c0_g1_i1.p1 TRINITY_DN8553_c0_g1~~TRINITY_DN8553_c0_g1_i1.p1  ORF type:complete len:310 (+),score=42.37 TRINITY_DN8553_c0_g1_i1:122-931(+)